MQKQSSAFLGFLTFQWKEKFDISWDMLDPPKFSTWCALALQPNVHTFFASPSSLMSDKSANFLAVSSPLSVKLLN